MTRPRTTSASRGSAASGDWAFGRPFWFAYLANTSMMVAISLLFRYSDYVKSLGGSEFHLGLIVGIGMAGSLVMRAAQGMGIDALGPRKIWIWSTIGFVVACLGHVLVPPAWFALPCVVALRILYQTSVAGVFGASITYVGGRAPAGRTAEIVGTLGTSGFIGMMLGTALGDAMLAGPAIQRVQLDHVFVVAALLGIAALGLASLATSGHSPAVRSTPSIVRLLRRHHPDWNLWSVLKLATRQLVWLLRRYHPGVLLLVGVIMGFGLGLPQIFVRPFAEQAGIAGIAVFFAVYPPVAFLARLSIRRWPERVGIRPVILLGISSLVASMLLFLVVQRQWQLVIPAAALGVAHACLFPCVIAGGSAAFPGRYRGLGTTLVLAMFDLGNLIGSPTVGTLIAAAQRFGLPPYPTTFVVVSAILAACGLVYAATSRRAARPDGQPRTAAIQRRRLNGPPAALTPLPLARQVRSRAQPDPPKAACGPPSC